MHCCHLARYHSQKRAIVCPLLKKPKLYPDDLNSYRLISNLTFASKLVKRVVAEILECDEILEFWWVLLKDVVAVRFMKHVDDQTLLPARQSAYRRFHSTETAITTVHNDLVQAADADQVTALVLLDLSSAFDTVDHDILLLEEIRRRRRHTTMVSVLPPGPVADIHGKR